MALIVGHSQAKYLGNLTKCPVFSYSGFKARDFLDKSINDLCGKRDEVHKQILQEEEEKQKLQNDIRILTERLAKVNESLSKKMASRNEFDRTIAETEGAYMKITYQTEYNNYHSSIYSSPLDHPVRDEPTNRHPETSTNYGNPAHVLCDIFFCLANTGEISHIKNQYFMKCLYTIVQPSGYKRCQITK
ncbi:SSNA1-like protein [Mya arenaria]|uniref:SSNA1-like protein n=1 Tax=Mya arenaria TaxID=6604 RepID=A0ABY7GDC8_MYAAR|nr:SSNA1-like protein [Mya arenaria]